MILRPRGIGSSTSNDFITGLSSLQPQQHPFVGGRIRQRQQQVGTQPRRSRFEQYHALGDALRSLLPFSGLRQREDSDANDASESEDSAEGRLPKHLQADSSDGSGRGMQLAFAGAGGNSLGSGTLGHSSQLLRSTISALNTLAVPLSTGELSEEDFSLELHEDISVEHQPFASSISSNPGRASYEVLRIDRSGKTRRIYIKRRDLLRRNRLLPRDLRRIDPSLSVVKTSPSISIKDHALLVNLGGVRMIVNADKALVFEPNSAASRKMVDLLLPRLAASDGERAMRALRAQSASESSDEQEFDVADRPPPPFELELLEAALTVATARLDEELLAVTTRVRSVLAMLPREVTPVGLEELRRVKQLLIELESKADLLRNMLEELMDDQEDMGDINLSSRPKREERSRQRDRDALEREMEREARREGQRSSSTSIDGFSATSADTEYSQYLQSERRSFDAGEENGFEGAEEALARLNDREEAEREAEEVEDLLEYYMQRAATLQSESERLLAGARDLEESIGVSLSARRFEVQRLELTLSIGSFAAALGAMAAGIFGMNLRSTFEESVVGFWGTTAAIVLGCCYIFWGIYRYMQQRRIL